jgi:hypothetical protein
MRKVRELAENVWYIINTSANNGELLFQTEFGVWLFGGRLVRRRSGMRLSYAGFGSPGRWCPFLLSLRMGYNCRRL